MSVVYVFILYGYTPTPTQCKYNIKDYHCLLVLVCVYNSGISAKVSVEKNAQRSRKCIQVYLVCLALMFLHATRLIGAYFHLSLYSDLLSSSQRPHIRQFAVESFGFLLRKV